MEGSARVVIVGAGPTGLTLAVQLLAAKVPFRLIDTAPTPVHESRALAIQARTLEVLERCGIAARLVEQGDTARLIQMHGSKTVSLELFDGGEAATKYPFLLFISQAQTEQILAEHLAEHGVVIERGTTLVGLVQGDDHVDLTLGTPAGEESIGADYVVGCDGAHSAVRRLSGIEFAGKGFPQTFAIADVEVDGLGPGPVHAYVAEAGIMFFFPLGEPAPWRLLAMLPNDAPERPDLRELQRVVDSYAGAGALRLHDPVWLTDFRVQSRHARNFRDQRILLAGDAAHIHSPAGAQGMNTGIQDATNLGWKLAQVLQGRAPIKLLDTYEEERLPIAVGVLRMTNRLFGMATTSNPLIRFVRPRIAPGALSLVRNLAWARAIGFRTISQLSINYRRATLARTAKSRSLRGLRAGDRLPPLRVVVDGVTIDLQDHVPTPSYLLAAIGAGETASPDSSAAVEFVRAEWPTDSPYRGQSVWLLARPDGYIAGLWHDPQSAESFLNEWTLPD